ncbi:UDP-glucose 4-epimerase GalE [Mangrovihabitans endophyticus]|uniref:UDP-glucose 4-epimerase n=1 Tax=Mangrovihabitans endophyticus TaxID=1751298 RepID=A0A8J3BXW0_9ACTN|nr:UDP-glucose 4-epimerase GalE [Mangrovihabitans endophyticus]GGK81295.1 UDP-glucose 4-epimerase [Mangrovihabitans endophyticus]
MRTVLVTGGAGFIGSHTCVDLLEHGYETIVVDNYTNSSPTALDRVQKIAGRPLVGYVADLRDRHAMDGVFERHPIDAVIHFAAKKAVGESMRLPIDYYDVNLAGTTSLLRSMQAHGVRKIVFSSSCSIYGDAVRVPLAEEDEARPTNPYARSKWICEQILRDACERYPDLSAIALRYFNPIGAHPSGLLGEVPTGVPNNVVPYLMQVAVGRLERLSVFGGDYATADGTAVRDYIHVLDVVAGHRVAMEHLDDERGLRVLNLGTGVGTSVLQLVNALSEACGRELPYVVADRRPGDVPTLIADPGRAERLWGWRATRGLADMCHDAWRFQRLNPAGYAA